MLFYNYPRESSNLLEQGVTLVLGVATLYSPLLYVALAGFEPATTGFKVLRTTNCATGQFLMSQEDSNLRSQSQNLMY